jgi:hypothetical protein
MFILFFVSLQRDVQENFMTLRVKPRPQHKLAFHFKYD